MGEYNLEDNAWLSMNFLEFVCSMECFPYRMPIYENWMKRFTQTQAKTWKYKFYSHLLNKLELLLHNSTFLNIIDVAFSE